MTNVSREVTLPNADETHMLKWLCKEDTQQYGECHGHTLDALISKGWAEVLGEDTGTHNNFIAKGRGIMYRAVRITDAGRAELEKLNGAI